MELCVFPALPNSTDVRSVKGFYWSVAVRDRLSIGHRAGSSPLVELTPARPVGSPLWMGDILSWPATGEFILAVNRGLVVSMAVRGLRVHARPAKRDRILSADAPDGPVFITYEWDQPLHFVQEPDGWLAVTDLETDLPLMLYLYAASPDDTATVTCKRLERLTRADLGACVAHVQKFENDLPAWKAPPPLERLWKFVYHLHRVCTYEAEPPFGYAWECLCRDTDYQRTIQGHWDTLHIVWDWLLTNPQRAREEFANYLRAFDEDSGMMAIDVAPAGTPHWPKELRQQHGGRNFGCSHPPLWPWIAWQLYLVTRDRNLLEEVLRVGLKNLAWWEHHRDTNGDGLFEYADTAKPQHWESGYDASPRFDNPDDRRFASIDLCCQMTLFYRMMERFAAELHESALEQDMKARGQALLERVRRQMWDPEARFFYDLRQGDFVRVRAIGSFFALLSGVADGEQVAALAETLADEKRFFSPHPVPSVAMDEPSFQMVYWRGPTWVSQTLWTVAGLRRSGRPRLAGQIARRALDAMAQVLDRDGTVYECYSPLGPDQSEVRYKPGGRNVGRYYLGHAPVHALALLGLYGIEMTRDGLVIDPVAAALPDESTVELQLPEGRLSVHVRRTDDSDGISIEVLAGKRRITESFGRTLIGLGQLL